MAKSKRSATPNSTEKNISSLKELIPRFTAAADRFPSLFHCVLRGLALEVKPGLLEMFAEAVVEGNPLISVGSIQPPYRYFFGHNPDGMDILRELSKQTLDIALHGLGLGKLVEDKNSEPLKLIPAENEFGVYLPPPWHFTLEKSDVEHDLMLWVAELGARYEDPRLGHHHGKPKKLASESLKDEQFYCLPNGKPIGRHHDGAKKPNIFEHPNFFQLSDAFSEDQLGEITIFDRNVFSMAAAAVDVLCNLLVEGDHRPKTTKPLGRPSDTDMVFDRRIGEAWRTGMYKTFAEAGSELGLGSNVVKRAVDRDRKRLQLEGETAVKPH